MKRWLCIDEGFGLTQTDDENVKNEWIEDGYMVVDTQEGSLYKYVENVWEPLRTA